MRLNTLVNNDAHIEELNEAGPRKSKVEKDAIFRPLGIKQEEFTPDYIEALEDIRDRRPDLWHKIKNGL